MATGKTHRLIVRMGLVGLTLFPAACSAPSAAPNTIEIINWWRKGGEAPALRASIDLFHRKHPSQHVSNFSLDSSTDARGRISEQMIGGEPPDSFQANGGWDLLAWVLYNDLDDSESKMERLDGDAGWRSAIPTPVLDTVSVQEHIYAVPLNIHRVNTLFFNKMVFAQAGFAEPSNDNLKTLDDLFALSDRLRQQGVATPIAMGTKDSWTLALLFFENLLVARTNGSYYRNFFFGTDDVLTSIEIQTAIADLWKLLSYDSNAGTRTWDTALDLVRSGGAAMTIMGDWAKGYFLDRAKEDQVEVPFGTIATPGTEGTFVFTTDTFGLPKGARNPDGARQLLQLFASREGQDTFNPIKGSIPARKDGGMGPYDEMARATLDVFRQVSEDRTKLVPATAILARPEYMNAVFDMLAYFAGNEPRPGLPPMPELKGNASVVLHGLQNWSDVLRNSRWHW